MKRGAIMRVVEDTIDDHGMAQLAKKLSKAMSELKDLESEKEDEAKEWKERLAGQRGAIERLRASIDNGKHIHDVECVEVMFPEEGVVRLRRKDTGEYLPDNHNRRMTDAESSLPLPFPTNPAGGYELTWPDGAPFERDHIVVIKERLEAVAIELYKVLWVRPVAEEPGMPPGAELQKAEGTGKWTVTLVEYGNDAGEHFEMDAGSLRLAGDLDFDEKGVERLIQETAADAAAAAEVETVTEDDQRDVGYDLEDRAIDTEADLDKVAEELEAEAHDRAEAQAEADDDLEDEDGSSSTWDDLDEDDDD